MNGRQKGSRGELAVAKIMLGWWTKYEKSALFIRTPLSGGWQKSSGAASHFKACGDLMSTSANFPFCIEVKWREAWNPGVFLDGKPCQPWSWWHQTCVAANEQKSVPMLWMRRNRIPNSNKPFPWIVMLPKAFVEFRNLDGPDMQWDMRKLATRGVDVELEPVGYDFNRFLKMDPVRMVGVRRGGTSNA